MLWHSLNIHDHRSANTRSEKPKIREERAIIGQVALIKLAFLISRIKNLKTHARNFEEECCIIYKYKYSFSFKSNKLHYLILNATSHVHFHAQTKWYIQLAVHFHTSNCTHFVKKNIPGKMKNSKRIKTAFSRSYQFSHFSFTLKLYKIPLISLNEVVKSFPYSRIKKKKLCPISFHRLSWFLLYGYCNLE